jgi:hypothetical protein
MVIRKIIFTLGLSVSFSCMALPQPVNTTVTTPQTPPPASSATSDNSKENQQQSTDKKPSMAEYCKEHTC